MHRGRTFLGVSAAALVLLLHALPVSASTTVVYAASQGQLVALSPAGGPARGGFTTYGDVTYGWPRTLIARSGPSTLTVAPEGATTRTEVFTDPAMVISSARWSRDDRYVAIVGHRTASEDAAGQFGIWLADAVRDGDGFVTALNQPRLAVSLPSETSDVSWASDGRTLAYTLNLAPPGKPAANDVFVADTVSGLSRNATNTPWQSEYSPAYDPTGDRIAFTVTAAKSGPVRSDIFVLDLVANRVVQVTNKNNASAAQITGPAWSPDGARIAFMGYPLGLRSPSDVLIIRADGREKALTITGYTAQHFGPPLWRP